MKINKFRLEDFFSNYEFSTPKMLCASDAESFSIAEILQNDESAINGLLNLKLNYTQPWGSPSLRKAICSVFYPGSTEENVLCFSGAEEGIFCTLHSLCQDGDEIIVFTPAYQSLTEIPKLKKANVTEIALKKDDKWNIDLAELESVFSPKTKGIVLNFPHNPTGAILSQQAKEFIVELCKKNNAWIFVDEVYLRLNLCKNYDPFYNEEYPNLIRLGVMSKSFGLAGLRIGWLHSKNVEYLKQIQQLKNYTTICGSAPAEYLAELALNNHQKFLTRNQELVKSNFAKLQNFMNKYQHLFSWQIPQAGCVAMIEVVCKKLIQLDFVKRALDERKILLLPGEVFGKQYSSFFRIGFGRIDFEQILTDLEHFITILTN